MSASWIDPSPDPWTDRRASRDRANDAFMASIAEKRAEQAQRAQRKRLKPSDVVVRAAASELLRNASIRAGGVQFHEIAEDVTQRLYGRDEATVGYLSKAAVNPAQTTVAGWAQELITTSVADFLTDGEPASAFGELAGKCLRVDEAASVRVPARAHPLVIGGAWISEASPKPVFAVTLSSITLTPFKVACINAWTDETVQFSVASIENLVRDAVRLDLNGLLDQTLLGAGAASATRPAGLWASATAVTPSTTTPKYDAMIADLQGLYAAVTLNAPGARPVYIVNGKQSLPILGLTQANPRGFELVVSNYMAIGSVGVVDANSLAVMLGDLKFQSSSDATVHADSSPLAIGTTGSPPVVAAPTINLFQADLIGLRSTLVASWGLRRSGATALATSVLW